MSISEVQLHYSDLSIEATLCADGAPYECELKTGPHYAYCISQCDVNASIAIDPTACDPFGCCVWCYDKCVKCSKWYWISTFYIIFVWIPFRPCFKLRSLLSDYPCPSVCQGPLTKRFLCLFVFLLMTWSISKSIHLDTVKFLYRGHCSYELIEP